MTWREDCAQSFPLFLQQRKASPKRKSRKPFVKHTHTVIEETEKERREEKV